MEGRKLKMKNKKIAIKIGVMFGIILIGAIALCVVNIKKNAKKLKNHLHYAIGCDIFS